MFQHTPVCTGPKDSQSARLRRPPDEVIGNETLSVIRTSRRFGSNLCRVDNSAKLCGLSGFQKNGKAEHRDPALPNHQKRFTAEALLQEGKLQRAYVSGTACRAKNLAARTDARPGPWSRIVFDHENRRRKSIRSRRCRGNVRNNGPQLILPVLSKEEVPA